MPDATCATLQVPLDRTGARKGSLTLRVAMAGRKDAPVLVFLSGGPGEPGLPFFERARKWLGPAAESVRLVAIDQRGTGADALDCPALQKEMGASDLTPPTRDAVESCADELGDERRFFTTADTVEDLEALRIALHADELALDGVSYGTYVAQRYALAHPDRVSRLVLDSVVPADGVSLLSDVSIKATERVLGKDASEDLATVVRRRAQRPATARHAHLAVGRRAARRRLHRRARPGEHGRRRRARPLAEGRREGRPRLDRGGAQPGPAREHAVRGLAGAVGRRVGAAGRPHAGARCRGREARRRRPLPVRPRDRDRQRLRAPVPVLAAGRRSPSPPRRRTCPPCPSCCSAATATSRPRWSGREQAAERAPKGRLIVVKGAGHGVQGQGDPEALAAVQRFVAALR